MAGSRRRWRWRRPGSVGGELPPLRSAQVSFVGPLYGEVEARARVLRRGKNATWVSAEVLRDGEVGLTASFVFMGPVESSLHLNDCRRPPALIPLDEARPSCRPAASRRRSCATTSTSASPCRAARRSARRCAGGCGRKDRAGLDPALAAGALRRRRAAGRACR